jgi:pheromone shutdown protein TraB
MVISHLVAAALGVDQIEAGGYHPMLALSSITAMATTASMATPDVVLERLADASSHILAVGTVLGGGLLALVPVVKVVLTERDDILTDGIRAACRRAGRGGRVVAVLGLLHVNGVARRMLLIEKE